MFPHLNFRNWITRSHLSQGENRTRSRSESCKCKSVNQRIPHYAIPYDIVQYHTMLPHFTMSYHTIPYNTIPYHAQHSFKYSFGFSIRKSSLLIWPPYLQIRVQLDRQSRDPIRTRQSSNPLRQIRTIVLGHTTKSFQEDHTDTRHNHGDQFVLSTGMPSYTSQHTTRLQ